MPIVDKPLSELRKYMGTNPCPADFDEYWDKRTERLSKIVPKYEFSPAPVAVKGYELNDLDFYAEDGSKIHCKTIRPAGGKKAPVLYSFHGLGGDSGTYASLMRYAAAGYAVVAMDCRAQAGLSEDRAPRYSCHYKSVIVNGIDAGRDSLYYVSIFSDIIQQHTLVKSLGISDGRYYATGGSQGGALTLACAGLLRGELVAFHASYPYLSDYKRIYEMDLLKDAYQDIATHIRNHIPDPESPEREKFWETLGYIDVQNFAHRITARAHFYTGLMDTVCPPSTQFAIYNKITSPKEMQIASNHGHEDQSACVDETYNYLCSLISE